MTRTHMNLDMDNVTAIGQDSVIQEKQTCIEDKSNQDSQKDHRRSRTVLFLYCALLIRGSHHRAPKECNDGHIYFHKVPNSLC